MDKQGPSIEDIRVSLLEQMTAACPSEEGIVIHFCNDDVDNYLKMLDRYENRPSENLILVK